MRLVVGHIGGMPLERQRQHSAIPLVGRLRARHGCELLLVEEPKDRIDPLFRKPQPDHPVPGKRDLGGRPCVAREVLVEPRKGHPVVPRDELQHGRLRFRHLFASLPGR